ncbi:MAG: thiamine phosphate synthase [Pseudomonadota bacterium]|uniref:thiamine phosphate synthase n=1 Tax=Roseovarius TaxID=74030 RepID=UPI0022A7403B|nr:thiamine phosphate synthase [Roseovarius sp. EGI FJ00037]MCZ0810981.1 thiamine phosphate synthase [Roseovarius sp. EGI FJ00037]
MAETEQPQIYLVTPREFELSDFCDRLGAVIDAHEVACVRLALATQNEDRLSRAADACREITHARDIALVIDSHLILAERLGLDGVHLSDGARSVRKARKALGNDAIVGAYCAASRHEGMNAGEAGADYVGFGPVGATALGDGSLAGRDLFEWWSQMIELPVVAEGALDATLMQSLAPVTDFFAIGDEIWTCDDPAAELGKLIAAMG